ncbi:MAG TPA: hypothetical protein VLF91_05160 [Candidatus Saccharimonadales bacterium]|nr:hypothetical protein [Candidatus Saccharimonadales bacterium]
MNHTPLATLENPELWLSIFRFTDSVDPTIVHEDMQLCRLYQSGMHRVFQSLPHDRPYLAIRLSVDDTIATGSWERQFSDFANARIWGALQMVVDNKTRSFKGVWVGFDSSIQVMTGSWEIKPAGKQFLSWAPQTVRSSFGCDNLAID